MPILRPVSDPVQRALATAARLREHCSSTANGPIVRWELVAAAREAADELEALAQYVRAIEGWKEEGEALLSEDPDTHSAFFMLGCWWADRPWRRR